MAELNEVKQSISTIKKHKHKAFTQPFSCQDKFIDTH